MDENDESVLEYARRCGIAVDHRSISPLSLIKQLRESDSNELNDDLNGVNISASITMENINAKIRSEKLEVSKDVAAYLSTILSEMASITRGEKVMSEEEWCASFPDYPRQRKEDLKVDMPLLTSAEVKSMATFSERPATENMIFDAIRSLSKTGDCDYTDEGLASLECLAGLEKEIDEDLQHEKLDCSRDAMAVLRETLRPNEEQRRREVEELVDTAIKRPYRPISPLYIEIERESLSPSLVQYQRGSSFELRPPNSTNMVLGCDPEPRHQAKPMSLPPNTRVVESTIPDENIPSGRLSEPGSGIEALICKTDPGNKSAGLQHGDPSALRQPEDIPASEPEAGGNVEEFSPHFVTKSSAAEFPTVPLKRKQSLFDGSRDCRDVRSKPPIVGTSIRWTEQTWPDRGSLASRRPYEEELTNGAKVSNVTALQNRQGEQEITSVLGTLDSFMQVRGRTVKRKLNNASPYFAHPVIESRTEPPEDQNESMERAVPYIPQNSINAHVPDIPSSMSPSILVLSSTLLQSDLDLVRHFERMNPTPQLIFREYQRSQRPSLSATHTGPENEADVIVSPQAGVLLITSQETTHTYLPGHPSLSRGYTSPIQERISKISVRYEKLYILVRIPGDSIDARVLSAICSLNGFCMALGSTCEIRPLLVAVSDTAKWISALAYRESISLPLPVDNIFPEGQEEETLWEVFLRQVGMNPFAARVALAVASEDNEVSKLSAFVEMEPQRRRAKFGPLLGERVVRKIERVLETDWQIDWAVDL